MFCQTHVCVVAKSTNIEHDNQNFKCFPHYPRGYFHIRWSRRGLALKFASEVHGAPNFASKNIGDKYPKFFPLNFRYDLKICVVVLETEGNI